MFINKICILGSGTWGIALANLLSNKGYDVMVYSISQIEIDNLKMNHKHKNLPGALINKNIKYTLNIEDAIKDKDVIVFATPSIFIRETAKKIKSYVKKEQILVTVAKGIEEDTLFTMSNIINDELGKEYKVVALSGPTHAEEVALSLATTIVSASKDKEAAKYIQELFSTSYLRVYTNDDIEGVELCGALKNIIALASGISDGLGNGDNAKAAIITRGLAEITRLGLKIGYNPSTFYGLSGIGDIVVTSTSIHSRNYNAGFMLGKGTSLKETLENVGMVVEGINALKSAHKLYLKYNVEMPITNVVYDIVYNAKKPSDALKELFSRDLKKE